MTSRVPRKWRPTLSMIIFTVLATVLALPLVGLFFFRLYENQLIRQAEAELIAQSAVLASVFARDIAGVDVGILGQVVPPDPGAVDQLYHPIEASLDLTSDDLLGRRPDARPAGGSASPRFQALGARLQPVVLDAQKVTLAGFRLLDPHGIVIAGRAELGQSLAHIEEVSTALAGRYRAVLRTRISDQPTPPLYSISRGTSVRVFTAMPVVVGGHVAGVIYASRTPSNIIKHIYSERGKFILAALATLGVTLAIGVIFSRVITGPIHALVARAADIGRGNPDALAPISHHGTREIALLSESFLDMAERLRDRSDYIATFAAHVSHELKTPLTSIQGAAELMRDDIASSAMTADERSRFLANIIGDTKRLTAMLNRLRELARADNPPTHGTTTLAAMAAVLRDSFPMLRVQAEGDVDRVLGLSLENASIVFSHLADNAACHGATTIRITATGDAVTTRLVFGDDGEGISPNNRAQIFDAFFTTRRDSGGTGMGLGIVQALLRAHGGTIRLLDGAATCFELTLPAA